jgi:hypothetical protein
VDLMIPPEQNGLSTPKVLVQKQPYTLYLLSTLSLGQSPQSLVLGPKDRGLEPKPWVLESQDQGDQGPQDQGYRVIDEQVHSIRINNQWRICSEWRDGDAYNV